MTPFPLIDANRRTVIRALKHSKNQCKGDLFHGVAVCAIGCAARALLGIKNERQWKLYESDGKDAWNDTKVLLGEDNLGFMWRMNDNYQFTLPEIGAECERRWFGEAS